MDLLNPSKDAKGGKLTLGLIKR